MTTTSNPAVFKLISLGREWYMYKGIETWIIPDDLFTPEEIESLREEDKFHRSLEGEPYIANFLPDGERPDWIKKL